MRTLTAILGLLFIWSAFTMTSWRPKGDQRDRPPTFAVQALTIAIGALLIFWFFRWPF